MPLSWGGFEEVVASGLGASLQDARVQGALKASMCGASSNSAARGKFAVLNASGWAVPPLC